MAVDGDMRFSLHCSCWKFIPMLCNVSAYIVAVLVAVSAAVTGGGGADDDDDDWTHINQLR